MDRKNNFDFLRLIFASFVIISHSYPISGIKECDWLCQMTNDQMSFSYIGVKGFFIISGFLIFQSLERSKSLLDYYWKRFLRLFPGLFVVLLITLLLAPFVYEDNTIPYLYNKSMWTYLPNNLSLYRTQNCINGVFESNPYKSAINSSLWTIPYEFTMYVLLSFMYFFRKKTVVTKSLLILSFVFLAIGNIFFYEQLGKYGYVLSGSNLLDLGSFFIAGSLLASLKIDRGKYFNLMAYISIVIITGSFIFNYFESIKILTLPIIIIWFGQKSTPIINKIGIKIGDLSYGIYIYAFPVQQTLVHYFRINYLELMFFSFIISFTLAYFSWHLIEARALNLKNMTGSRLKKT